MHPLTRAAGLAALLLLAGCASGTGTGSPEPASAAPSTSPSTPSTAPTSTAQPPRELTVDGVAEPGVEPGCVVLRAAGKQYLLVGAGGRTLTGVPLRVPIRVRAAVLTGVFTYCQQGTPIQVLQISRR